MLAQSERISMAAERAELETVAEALCRSSRLAHLLRYMGEKCFHGEGDQLTEYNIATEVFGRSKTVFDAGEDAIARVEAHRLRKRLKDSTTVQARITRFIFRFLPDPMFLSSRALALIRRTVPSSIREFQLPGTMALWRPRLSPHNVPLTIALPKAFSPA